MLLAIDAGNTNVVFALVDGRDIKARWRIATDPRRTADHSEEPCLGGAFPFCACRAGRPPVEAARGPSERLRTVPSAGGAAAVASGTTARPTAAVVDRVRPKCIAALTQRSRPLDSPPLQRAPAASGAWRQYGTIARRSMIPASAGLEA